MTFFESKSVVGFGPLFEDRLVGFDEVFFNKLALLDSQPATFFPIINNSSQRKILVLQAGLIGFPGRGVRIVDLGAIDFLEGIHRADGADQLKVGVVVQQIAGEIERQGSDTAGRHEVADLQAHLAEVFVGEGVLILLVFDAQHRVMVFGPAIGLAARHAQTNDRLLLEVLLVGA